MLKSFETDRLTLRERTLEDLEACVEMDSDPEVIKYIPELAKLVTGPLADKEVHKQFVKNRITAEYPSGMGYWTIETKDKQKEFIGWIMLIPIDMVGPEIEIGWRLKRQYWGKGYATEAAKVILNYALDDLKIKEIVADIESANKGSVRIAEKLGFHILANHGENGIKRHVICRI